MNTYVKNLLKILEKNGFEAYLVGGSVRDKILNRKTNDFDIATNALPQDLVRIFGNPIKNIEYGCYHIKHNEMNIDITTYRVEKKYVAHHPTHISYTVNLLEDAKRRDFTMNAIYESKNGSRIDPYHGEEDLKKQELVCIGDPIEKLSEDPERLLHAIRFSASLGLTIDEKLKEAINVNKNKLKTLSIYVIKKELDKIFLANGFDLLKEFELDKILSLDLSHVVYVSDLAGLWAQVIIDDTYLLEKELKNTIKKMRELLKCGTISLDDLYEYGYYTCTICGNILNIPSKQITAYYKSLPIKSRNEIKIKGNDIAKFLSCDTKEIGPIIKNLEKQIIHGKLKNKRKAILNALERMKKNADD